MLKWIFKLNMKAIFSQLVEFYYNFYEFYFYHYRTIRTTTNTRFRQMRTGISLSNASSAETLSPIPSWQNAGTTSARSVRSSTTRRVSGVTPAACRPTGSLIRLKKSSPEWRKWNRLQKLIMKTMRMTTMIEQRCWTRDKIMNNKWSSTIECVVVYVNNRHFVHKETIISK